MLVVRNAAEVAEKAKAFRFTAEDLAALMRGEKPKTINGIAFNGTLTVLGATTLLDGGDWRTDHPAPRFFKAILTR